MNGQPAIEPYLRRLRGSPLGVLYLWGTEVWLRHPREVRLLNRDLPHGVVAAAVTSCLGAAERTRLETEGDAMVVFQSAENGRFRLQALRVRGAVGAVVTALPAAPPTLEEVGIPFSLVEGEASSSGIVVVAGPARSGRTSACAALLEAFSSRRDVVSVEDPVEIPLSGGDQTFQGSSPASPRPGAIVAFDRLDAPRRERALRLAESGHLVLLVVLGFAPSDARRALTRCVHRANSHETRSRFARKLLWMSSQRLLPAGDGDAIVHAGALTVFDDARRRSFETDPDDDFDRDVSRRRVAGDRSLNDALAELHAARRISLFAAMRESPDPDALVDAIGRGRPQAPRPGEA